MDIKEGIINIVANTIKKDEDKKDDLSAQKEDDGRMNILVIGGKGAGKSTLIRALTGDDGKVTEISPDISTCDSSIWPFTFIDTQSFEDSLLDQLKTIRQIKKYTRGQAAQAENGDYDGIDAVWYCVDSNAKKLPKYDVAMFRGAIRGWKNIPVFAVLTKSFDPAKDWQNTRMVREAFDDADDVNLKGIFPVLAEYLSEKEDDIITARGIEELCSATLEILPEAQKILDDNRGRMVTAQRRFSANALIAGTAAAAAVVGAVPVPFADSAVLVPMEVGLTKGVLKAYKVDVTHDLVTGIVGSTAITNVAKAALSLLKGIPVAGSVLNAVVAAFFVTALGESTSLLCESINSGKLDAAKLDGVVDFVTDKLRENPTLGFAVKYLQDNASTLKDSSVKDIIDGISKSVKKKQ